MELNGAYDVGIVGGGLAGLCLAIQCADAGHSVVLFEKETYPFHKVCGEYISNESRGFLERLGAPLDKLELPAINQLQVSDNAGRCYEFPLTMGGFGISRYKLDNLLFQIAVQKGVVVLQDTKVSDVVFAGDSFSVQTQNNTLGVKVAAGCFGKRSNLDVKWKRSFIKRGHSSIANFVGVKYHVRFEHPAQQIALHNFNNGYCGISKIEDDKSCLCYLTTSENLKASNHSIKDMEQKVLCANPQLKDIFSKAVFLYAEPLTISQVSFLQKEQVENHMLMVGDSSGVITPLCGNGMSMAMHASKFAADLIHRFLSGDISRNDMEQNYSRHWNKEFAKRLWVGRNVQRLFGRETSTFLFLKTMHVFPRLANTVIKSTHGAPF